MRLADARKILLVVTAEVEPDPALSSFSRPLVHLGLGLGEGFWEHENTLALPISGLSHQIVELLEVVRLNHSVPASASPILRWLIFVEHSFSCVDVVSFQPLSILCLIVRDDMCCTADACDRVRIFLHADRLPLSCNPVPLGVLGPITTRLRSLVPAAFLELFSEVLHVPGVRSEVYREAYPHYSDHKMLTDPVSREESSLPPQIIELPYQCILRQVLPDVYLVELQDL